MQNRYVLLTLKIYIFMSFMASYKDINYDSNVNLFLLTDDPLYSNI